MCVTNSQRNVCYRSFTNQYKPQSYKNQALLPYSLPYNDEFLENIFNLVIRVLKKKKRLPWAMCKSKTKRSLNCPISPLKSQTGKRKKKNKNLRPFFFFFFWKVATTIQYSALTKCYNNNFLSLQQSNKKLIADNFKTLSHHHGGKSVKNEATLHLYLQNLMSTDMSKDESHSGFDIRCENYMKDRETSSFQLV